MTSATDPQVADSAGTDLPFRKRSRNLAYSLVEDIKGQIDSEVLHPGDKLPTESEAIQRYGVSRTVVREAMSRLEAAGLVETRHGIGTFVLQAPSKEAFRIGPAEIATLVDVLAVLELRISLESEAAGLAASRRSDDQLADMRRALDSFQSNIATAGDTVNPDFRFHTYVARATCNRYFVDIMEYLGGTLIPRTRIGTSGFSQEELLTYLHRINHEHQEIYDAIARKDPEAARAAMRVHLTNSRERLRKAQESIKAPG